MSRIGRHLSRVAALLILGVVLLATWLLLIEPVARLYVETNQQIEAERIALGRLEAASNVLAEAGTAATAQPASDQPMVLQGASEARALSALQTLVAQLAGRHGVRPSTSRMLPILERDGLRLAGMQIDVRAPLATVQKLLHALETARPVLIVEALTLEPVQRDGPYTGEVRAGVQVYGVLPAAGGS